jgi:predicted Zn-dependent protease
MLTTAERRIAGMDRSRIAFAGIAGALLCAGIHAAAVRGLADADSLDARTTLAVATQTKKLPEAADLNEAISALRAAVSLEPSNPLLVEQLGRALEMSALRLGRGDPAARPSLREALAHFRTAALMRPGSPYVWTAIAGVKLRLDEMDFEFYGALQRAARLGPWEPAIQVALADIGFAGWRFLAQPGKQLVVEAVERGTRRQEKELRALAVSHGTFGLLCADKAGGARLAICVKK